MNNIYSLTSILAIVYITGCTETSYQEYPTHWSAFEKVEKNGCVQISGVYPAVSTGDEVRCDKIKHQSWNQLIGNIDDSCVFLPDALLSWDGYLPATESVTDQIIIEQGLDSITINYVNVSENYMQLSLQRDKGYRCQGGAITLILPNKDMAGSPDRSYDSAHDLKSFYRATDGSLIYEKRYSYVRTSLLPPFIVNTRTNVWARWPLFSESVPDALKRIKSQFLKYAKEAIERGDMESAYRLLEDYLGSEDKDFRAISLQLFTDYPGMKAAAVRTFSIQSLEHTLLAHGEKAKAIEQERLEIYKSIATEEEYQKARENLEEVFSY